MKYSLIKNLIGLLILGAGLYYLANSMINVRERLVYFNVIPHVSALIVAGVLSLLWLMALIFGWIWILRHHTEADTMPGSLQLARVFLLSFLSRYIPGKVWAPVIRCSLLSATISPLIIIRSYTLEQLHLFASAGVLSVGVMIPLTSHLNSNNFGIILILVLALILASLWSFFPKKLFQLLRHLLPNRWSWTKNLTFIGSLQEWILGFGLFIIVGVLQGLIVVPIWYSIAGREHMPRLFEIVYIICAYAAARIIGQSVAVVPAGIGLREAAFVALSSGMSSEIALISVLWVRIVASSVELLAFTLVAWAQLPKSEK